MVRYKPMVYKPFTNPPFCKCGLCDTPTVSTVCMQFDNIEVNSHTKGTYSPLSSDSLLKIAKILDFYLTKETRNKSICHKCLNIYFTQLFNKYDFILHEFYNLEVMKNNLNDKLSLSIEDSSDEAVEVFFNSQILNEYKDNMEEELISYLMFLRRLNRTVKKIKYLLPIIINEILVELIGDEVLKGLGQKEAMKMLGISPNRFKQLIDNKLLSFRKKGAKHVFNLDDILKLAKRINNDCAI